MRPYTRPTRRVYQNQMALNPWSILRDIAKFLTTPHTKQRATSLRQLIFLSSYVCIMLWHNTGSPLFYWQKNPGLSRNPIKNFPGPFRSPRMFKYKEKTAFTYNIQSVVHCRKFRWSKMWTLAVQNWDELIYIWSQYTCSDCRSSLEVFQFK